MLTRLPQNSDNSAAQIRVMAQRRKHYRLQMPSTCTVIFENQRYDTRLLDLSLRGALVEAPAGLKPGVGHAYRLEVPLEDYDGKIVMEVAPVHEDGGKMGLNCFSIDMDSMTHLRRLLELNLGDPQLIERELRRLD